MGFRLVPKSVTFNCLKRRNGPYFAFALSSPDEFFCEDVAVKCGGLVFGPLHIYGIMPSLRHQFSLRVKTVADINKSWAPIHGDPGSVPPQIWLWGLLWLGTGNPS